MLKKLIRLLIKDKPPSALHGHLCESAPPQTIVLDGCPAFPLALTSLIYARTGFAQLDWEKAQNWIEHRVPPALRREARVQCERGWLLHLRDQLEPGYLLIENDTTFALSCLDQRLTQVALAFIDRAQKRILGTLQDVAQGTGLGKNILIIFADEAQYFGYLSEFYPDGHEIVRSSGAFLGGACGHFITMDADLSHMEPVIIHELTHSYLAHLPLPLWLNEGIAVNVERRLAGNLPAEFTAQQMRLRHQRYWTAQTIQTFWSGDAFQIQEASPLAYDLATLMVSRLGEDWAVFSQFALEAHWQDAGAQAMQHCFGADPGHYVCLMLDKDYQINWEPERAD